MSTYHIAASVLSADFAYLADDVRKMCAAGVDAIHFDVMDHHYVPNLTVGPMVCHALRQAGITASIDVHLMVTEPQNYIKPFADAGASRLSFHPDTVSDCTTMVENIHAAGMEAGAVFNPDDQVELSDALLARLDMVLLMSVYPGFGGQQFIPSVLDKIEYTRQRLSAVGASALLGVDGGIKVENIASVASAGADFFVMGSGLFSAASYSDQVQAARKALISI